MSRYEQKDFATKLKALFSRWLYNRCGEWKKQMARKPKQPSFVRTRAGQLNVRLDESLLKEYKDLLAIEETAACDDIERYIAYRLGKAAKVIDIRERLIDQQEEIEALKSSLNEIASLLKPDSKAS